MSQTLTKRTIAKEIHELLDIPLGRFDDPIEGTKMVNAIIGTIVAALHRGEDVIIRGFGIFRVRELKPRKNPNTIVRGNVRSPVPIDQSARKRVIFQPSYQLKAMLNPPYPSYHERRAMSIWHRDDE